MESADTSRLEGVINTSFLGHGQPIVAPESLPCSQATTYYTY